MNHGLDKTASHRLHKAFLVPGNLNHMGSPMTLIMSKNHIGNLLDVGLNPDGKKEPAALCVMDKLSIKCTAGQHQYHAFDSICKDPVDLEKIGGPSQCWWPIRIFDQRESLAYNKIQQNNNNNN